MFLKSLQLENFRNISSLDISFDPRKKVTVIIGENAQGKTNLLESVYFLALTKSFKTQNFEEVIMKDREHGRIKGMINDEEEKELEIAFGLVPFKQKKYKKDKAVTDIKKYLNNLNVVLFTPEDIKIIKGEPDDKRKYLNMIAIQTYKDFLDVFLTYKKALYNRNKALLSGGAHLEVWNEKLAEFGLQIWEKRAEIIAYFSKKINEKYQKLSTSNDKIGIEYQEHPQTIEEYLLRLKESYAKDLEKGVTHLGPHRDSFKVLLNGEDMKKFSSRGELRTAVLAMKLVELELIREFTGQQPVLLLDDVFSELDHAHQEHLISAILDHQSFITTTCREHIGLFGKDVQILTASNGVIAKEA
ncbi:MAG: hypothetical protein ACD_65C00115G0001 [uncultured bacterium]|nr:MAG: hypothetical protein ACD_65C00115G0001 [uncultured bacterium]KKT01713.1 MAG: replication and repair protein RecF, DNA replication and repair protein RecF protein [Candidatus Peregrinibacteria bacterium GW2011_GWF2_43_17]